MSLTMEPIETTGALLYLAPEPVTVNDWLYAMWGIEPGKTSSPRTSTATFPYPAPMAKWLHAMWGIAVPVDSGKVAEPPSTRPGDGAREPGRGHVRGAERGLPCR